MINIFLAVFYSLDAATLLVIYFLGLLTGVIIHVVIGYFTGISDFLKMMQDAESGQGSENIEDYE
jgi:hypothetical protein